MTNYEWLLNMSGEERQAWFDAEHVENQNGTLDGARAALDEKLDSRAKLEDDVREFFDACYARVVLRFIDRQAAISEAKVERKWSCYEGSVQAEIDRLTAQVDNLRAENDALMAAHADDVKRLDAMGEGELQAQVDVLTYERDYYIGLCHRAVEAGEKFATLVDMNGEVLS